MNSSQTKTGASPSKSRKRRKSRGSSSRARKKHKRLDAICDRPSTPIVNTSPYHALPEETPVESDDQALLRRSSRVRKVPVILDSSPVPSRRNRHRLGMRTGQTTSSGIGKKIRKRKKRKNAGSMDSKVKKEIAFQDELDCPRTDTGVLEEEETGDWGSRLRSRVRKGRGGAMSADCKRKLHSRQSYGLLGEDKGLSKPRSEEMDGFGTLASESRRRERRRRRKRRRRKSKDGDQPSVLSNDNKGEGSFDKASREEEVVVLSSNYKEYSGEKASPQDESKVAAEDVLPEDISKIAAEKASPLEKENKIAAEKASLEGEIKVAAVRASLEEESKVAADNSVVDRECERQEGLGITEQLSEKQEEGKCIDSSGGNSSHPIIEKIVLNAHLSENGGFHNIMDTHEDKLNDKASDSQDTLKLENLRQSLPADVPGRPRVREGRRCGLCGGGSDGKPPKKLVPESVDSDNEAYNGSSSSEEPNYDVWDGFGDEPEWLGRLLGPIHDRFGIARVWVHQHCAVWSPEVYFAGLGCLKNVRAALCRGRALKCSRCGRPGATIGCRVDRCPKTYHLPCARADGCIFDHHKFLIACTDHRHLFQPQGNLYLHQIKKMKARKMKLDMRKLSNDAWRKDLEAEEKWLENCGEDEEFLKREGKRLHRDISRIAPVYIGGSCSENEKLYEGWESVAGLQDVIQCMKEVVILPLLYPEFFHSLGLMPPRGVLLHGYPGTGKTLVVRALIGACSRGDKRIAYFARKGADCLGKYVGDAERQLRLLFQVAERCQPSIIFFDEIDGLAPCRSRQLDQTHNSVVSTLLSLLDGLKSRGSVIVIGATNRPEAVDPALRRPGRFDREIYFPLPSVKDRSAILSLHTHSWPKPVSGPVLSWIAKQTAGYAGADLQALCTQAAMIALKRNCALHNLLSSAEKGSDYSRRPSLPSFVVAERDWLSALACAPPPCSQREAGMAANDVVTSPLHSHLIPCLLLPLSHLLISLYLDERIWLPPALFKASKSIEGVISSALQEKRIPIISWKSHLRYLIQQPDIAKEIERNLSRSGLLIGSSAFVPSDALEDDSDDDHGKFDSYRLNHSSACIRSNTLPNLFLRWGKSSGFRALIAGAPRSGQQHLAACLLHGFVGHIEIQKVNLATISQEGRGDIIRGITQILLKCLSVGRCIVYMPRLDLWAVDEKYQHDIEESSVCPKTCKSSNREGLHDPTKISSQAWNSFVEQVDSSCRSASLIILATCEAPNHDLPVGIKRFFTSDVLNSSDSTPSEHTIPHFFVQVDGNFNHDLVIDSSAARISQDLVQHYVQFIHHRSHMDNAQEKLKVWHTTKANSEIKNLIIDNEETIGEMDRPMDSERIASNNGASCRNDQTQQYINGKKRWFPTSNITGDLEADFEVQCHQGSLSKIPPNKNMKGNTMLTIATLGYQILRYPHFAELCWATSKLKVGPCTDLIGPWKGWPFNSCVIHANHSTDKAACVLNSSHVKDREYSGVVRGLIAVGLLAYRGSYTSVKEVSFEVRKVLELLVGQISAKIQGGKDRYRFLRLLSQVAYLEDMINSWAYTFQRVQMDSQSQISTAGSRPVIVGGLDTDNHANGSKLLVNDASIPSLPYKSCNEVPEDLQKGPQSLAADNCEHIKQSRILVPESEPPHEVFSSAPFLSGLHPDSASAFPSAEGHCRSESTVPCSSSCKNLEHIRNSSGQSALLNCGSGHVSDQSNGLETVNPSNHGGFIGDEQAKDTESNLRKSNNISAISETLCAYDCCSACLHALHVLTREILTNCWESYGRCSTVDDVHDIVSKCSLNLLAALRKQYFSQSGTNFEECCSRKEQGTQADHCVCQDIGGIKLKKVSYWHKTSKHIEFFPIECGCHLRDREFTSTENACEDSPFRLAMKFFFRDSTLVSTNPPKGIVLHCKFGNLCVCSIIEMILVIKPWV